MSCYCVKGSEKCQCFWDEYGRMFKNKSRYLQGLISDRDETETASDDYTHDSNRLEDDDYEHESKEMITTIFEYGE